ncbi:hypothetical protein LTR08_006837 [Meristemomyces frigidus]|nr:hypothetical protein LTR08_006837 [Meristemomyces frigidus]
MSGAEAITAVQLIDACIDITKVIIDIGRAVHNAQGLPPKLQENEGQGQVTEESSKNAKPILRQCELALGELRDLFKKACPKDGDNRGKRIWNGTKTVFFGRDSQLQKCLDTILGNLRLLEQKEIYVIGDKLDELQELTEALAHDDGGKYTHAGAGNIVANEGGAPTNYVQGGNNNRQINGAGSYHEGPATITHNTYLPPERAETPPIPSSNVPFRRDPDYVDRKVLTDQIHAKLLVPAARVAVWGLGGVGKTQLIVECAYRLRKEFPWLLWIHASSATRFDQSIREIADITRIPGRNDPKVNALRLLSAWLCDESKGRWLIVLDNADDGSFLLESPSVGNEADGRRRIDYLPECDHGAVVITTRSKSEGLKLAELSDMIAVSPMDEGEAVALLENKLGQQADTADVSELAATLEFMPLALTQAAAYIQQGRCSVQQYLEKLQKSKKSKTSILCTDKGDLRRDRDAQNSILLTWQISFEHIYRRRQSAADLLSLMSFCDRQAIPEFLIRMRSTDGQTSDEDGSEWETAESSDESASETTSDDGFDEDIIMLEGYSFVSANTDASTFEMHRLVQFATQRWLGTQGQEQLERVKEQYIYNLSEVFPSPEYENWEKCGALYPHAKAAFDLKLKGVSVLLNWAAVMHYAAWYAQKQGTTVDAEKMSAQSIEVYSRLLGEEHPSTLAGIGNLAHTYKNQGRWKEAEELWVKRLEVSLRVLGEEHPSTLVTKGSLAVTYRDQGQLKKAEELQVEVLEARSRTLGEEHPETLRAIGNLASTYSNQGRLEEAEELEVKLLETRLRVLGEEHPDTLTAIGNLATTYANQGRLEEAEELQVKLLEVSLRVLGEEHPDTLRNIGNLASTYSNQGRLEEAEELRVKLLEARLRVLGEEHPDTLRNIGSLASTYWNQERYEEAEELMLKAVEAMSRVLGEEHSDTLVAKRNLAKIRGARGA